jgi:predicted RNase H-like HicB family nuclease
MKPVEYYLQLNYKSSIYRNDEGDFVIEVDDLPGCVTHGGSPDEAFRNLEEAKRAWVESRLAAGLEVPEPRPIEDYSGKVLLRMPRSLHRRLAEQSAAEKVSLNQYIVSLLSYASAGNTAFTRASQPGQVLYQAAGGGMTGVAFNYFVDDNLARCVMGEASQAMQVIWCSHRERPLPSLASSQELFENQPVFSPAEEPRTWERQHMRKMI